MSLAQTFADLPRPTLAGSYTCERSGRWLRAGRTYEEFPAVLISFPENSDAVSPPRRLANLVYTPSSSVEVTNDGKVRSERLAVLECRSTDSRLTEYFFRIVETVFGAEERLATESEFEAALDSIVSLFRSLQLPAQQTIQGLWGELAVIAWAPNTPAALSSWHSSPRALHDFAVGGYRLEVKTAAHGLREHRFQLDQLGSTHSGATLIASLMLNESASGASVFDLVAKITARLKAAEQAHRLEKIVAESLGENWRDADDVRYDLDAAREGLRIYAATQIPCVAQPLPAQVKDVSFTVDLSSTDPLDVKEAHSQGKLFHDLLSIQ